jgi:hypothetical protein
VIEPKVGFTLAQHTALVAIANDILGIGGYSFTSFSMTALDELRTLTSHATLYYIVTPTDANIDHVATKMPAVVYPTYTDVTQHVVQYAHSKGVKVAAWTIPTSQFDIMRKLGLDEFITDTIGPELNWQAVIYRGYSDGVYAGYTTSGVIGSDGIVTLDSGEQINFSPRPELATPLGAHYISIDLQGACTINSNNLAVSVNNTADDFATYAYQCMVKGVTPVLTITAGAGGCRVKDIRLAVAKF